MPHLNWLERGLVKPTWHLAFVMAFTVALVAFDFAVHAWFRSDYKEDTNPLVVRAGQQYYFELDPAGERFVLILERIPLEELPEDERSGPLGIGDTPSFRGTLARHALNAREVERRISERFAAQFAAFDREVDGTYTLALPGLPPGRFLRVEPAALERCFDQPDLASPQRLESLLLRSHLWAIEPVPPVSLDAVRAIPELVRTGLLAIAGALKAVREMDAAYVVTFDPQARAIVRDWCRSSYDVVLEYECTQAQDPCAAAQAPVPEQEDVSSLSALGASLTCRLQREIVEIAKAEITTGIWIYGPWRWFEIIFWVWFGVLTNALYGVGAIAVGMRRITFEPRETLWMFSRMLYAPLLAMIFFWIAESAVPFLGPETLLFNSTLLGLAIAFLIGMYPDNIYQLLATFFHRVLQSSKSADDRGKPKVQQVPVLVGVDPGAPPRLSDLADKIGSLVTAPLRKGGS